MGDQDLTPLDDFAKVRADAADGAQRQGGGADGHQRRAGDRRATPSTSRSRSCATPLPQALAGACRPTRAELEAQIEAEKDHVRQIVSVLQGDLKNVKRDRRRARASTRRTRRRSRAPPSDAFWAASTRTRSTRWSSWRTASPPRPPTPTCCSSATSAPTSTAFAQAFDRMKIVDGTAGARRASAASCSRSSSTRSSSSSRRRAGWTRSRTRVDVARQDDRQGRRAAAHGARERHPGARGAAAARRAQDRRLPRQAAARAGQPARPTSASCWPRSSQTDDAELRTALRVLLPRAGAVAGALPRPHRRHADHQGVHPQRLRAVGQPARLRHLPVPGAGEVDAGRRAEPDGPGSFRELYGFIPPRAQGDRGAAEGGRARTTSAARTPRPSCSAPSDDAARRGRRRGEPSTPPPRRRSPSDRDRPSGAASCAARTARAASTTRRDRAAASC